MPTVRRDGLMSSRTRETRIIAAVPCSVCGAAVGEPCVFTDEERRKLFDGPMLRGGIVVHGRRREAWQAKRAAGGGEVEREVDGRLSDRAAHYWPGAVVVCERSAGEERWWLERIRADGSLGRTGIGSDHYKAQRALGAIIRAHEAREREAAG